MSPSTMGLTAQHLEVQRCPGIGNGLPLAAVCYYAGRLQEYCHNACISTRTGATLCARLQAALCLRCWIKKRGRSTCFRSFSVGSKAMRGSTESETPVEHIPSYWYCTGTGSYVGC